MFNAERSFSAILCKSSCILLNQKTNMLYPQLFLCCLLITWLKKKKKEPYKHNRTTIRVKGEGIFSFYIHIKEFFILSPVLSSFDRKKAT